MVYMARNRSQLEFNGYNHFVVDEKQRFWTGGRNSVGTENSMLQTSEITADHKQKKDVDHAFTTSLDIAAEWNFNACEGSSLSDFDEVIGGAYQSSHFSGIRPV